VRIFHADRASVQLPSDGPEGCRFGDYWPLRLPLLILILLPGVPLILLVWSLA
jgi:hypothetical protein